ncbi:MAG: hypothetical protein M1812_006842 [Candelaria pacifica]|nr:MAG: hypothetical protein M1812_006842 [Candelaria pacifica]
MPVELRKRKASAPDPTPPVKRKSSTAVPKANGKEKKDTSNPIDSASGASKMPVVGDIIDFNGFGGEVETNDGEKVTLQKLASESTDGVVLFTYPKASTPGCTNQVCLFRDAYKPLTSTGFAIYGLSTDSPKANSTFKTKQNLPYPLLCDAEATLIEAIGFKKAPKGTTRGVFVVNKEGRVLAAEAGGPAATVDVVQGLVGSKSEDVGNAAEGENVEKEIEAGKSNAMELESEQAKPAGAAGTKDDKATAEVAADVADTAEVLDGDKAAA